MINDLDELTLHPAHVAITKNNASSKIAIVCGPR
jgi:hypothetical protein